MARERVAIVGAGIAGLTAAAILAGRADVSVFERQSQAGGKIRQTPLGNRAIDCGPTVFTLKPVFERIFALCGERLEDHVSITPLSVLGRHRWTDGSQLDLYADRDRTYEAIRDFAGEREAKAFRAYLKAAERNWKTLYSPMIEQCDANFARLLALTPPQKLIRLNPYVSLWKELSGRFKDDRLRQLFGRYTTYCGSSPFLAPAVMSMITHIEQEGVWSLDGGIKAIADALVRIGEKRGVTFHYDTDISAIETKAGRIDRVVTPTEEDFPIVVFNGDVAALERGSLGADRGAPSPPVPPSARSLSAVTLCFTGKTEGFEPSMHNVFFPPHYQREFESIFGRGTLPEDPTVYLYTPDHLDDPSEEKRFFCLTNAPANGDSISYTEREHDLCQSRILALLNRCGLNLTINSDSLVTTMPDDFASRFPATGGALYGKPIHGVRASFKRRGIRTRTKGLYCAGGSVHPGSGVPMAALSGLMAAQAIIKDYALI